MRSEFFYPSLADRQNRVAWEVAGMLDTRARACQRVEKLLRAHKAPGLPAEVDSTIRETFNVLL
jgi:trimethylamine:corrinoid methyltransferase-like protein